MSATLHSRSICALDDDGDVEAAAAAAAVSKLITRIFGTARRVEVEICAEVAVAERRNKKFARRRIIFDCLDLRKSFSTTTPTTMTKVAVESARAAATAAVAAAAVSVNASASASNDTKRLLFWRCSQQQQKTSLNA